MLNDFPQEGPIIKAMKTIHLLRHAKSSWADPDLNDRERPLNNRGKQSILLMIEPIWKAGCSFKNVYASPAKRTRSTIIRIAKALPENTVQWSKDENLYTFSAHDLLQWLHSLEDDNDEVMIVGHNPAITELANLLGDEYVENVPTCGYVQLQSEVSSWQDINANCATTTHFIYPKMFIDFQDGADE